MRWRDFLPRSGKYELSLSRSSCQCVSLARSTTPNGESTSVNAWRAQRNCARKESAQNSQGEARVRAAIRWLLQRKVRGSGFRRFQKENEILVEGRSPLLWDPRTKTNRD